MAVDSSSSFEEWLSGKPQEVAVLVTVRNALRTVPVLIGAFDGKEALPASKLTLATFRALASSFGAGVSIFSPGFADSGADYASDTISNAEESMDGPALACARAAVGAANVASMSPYRLLSAAQSSVSASHQALLEQAAHLKWSEISHDAAFVDSSDNVESLALSALYAYGPRDFSGVAAIGETAIGAAPDELFFPWYRFRDLLQKKDENWEIWIRWYEDRLLGRPFNLSFGKALLKLHDNDWDNDPRDVNNLISFLMRNDQRQQEDQGVLGDSQTAADQVGPLVVSASDRTVSVRHNQEPFDILEEKLEQVLHELRQNQNAWKFHLKTYESDLSLIQDILEQKQAGEVDRESLSKLDRLLNRLTEKAGVIFLGALGGAALPGFVSMLNMAREAISKILGIAG